MIGKSVEPPLAHCDHRQKLLRTERCQACRGRVMEKVFACDVHRECQLGSKLAGVKSCVGCSDRTAVVMPREPQPATHDLRLPTGFDQSHQWLWRSFDDLNRDLRDWSDRLPRLQAVCGVPRSGVVVASQLATLLNLPLIPIERLRDGDSTGWRPANSKPLAARGEKVLVVDDTLWSGRSMRRVRQEIGTRPDVLFGAVYANPENTDQIDISGFGLPSINHTFAWNYLRDIHSRHWLTDMDGVLCGDWPGQPDDDGQGYSQWIKVVSPRIAPIFGVRGIVTGRVESYRQDTVDWLRDAGVKHDRLVMPFATVAARRGQDVGAAKARVYGDDSGATVFVESDIRQARRIFDLTRRPVVCSDTLEMLQ